MEWLANNWHILFTGLLFGAASVLNLLVIVTFVWLSEHDSDFDRRDR